MSTGPRDGSTAAFFDVDETLISIKSMFRFLDSFFAGLGRPPEDARAVREELGGLAAAGAPRAETNRRYYEQLRGHRVDAVAAAGRAWFAAEAADPGLFHRPVVDRLESHRRAGHLVVLVSGSFSACLEPVREALGAHLALGTRPVSADGRYTGAIDGEPVIGPGKERAARAVMLRHGIDPERSWAYADDASDREMLACVGNPVVVGGNPVLLDEARKGGWTVMEPREPVSG